MRSLVVLLAAGLASAQTDKPFQSQSTSSVVSAVKDGQRTIEIVNVDYELAGRLLLRKTTRTKRVVDEIGIEAATTVEAWPLGVDPRQKPVYTLKADGVDCKTVDGAMMTIRRGLEDTEWWSVYKLGTGERLFDTYVPLLGFSIRRDIQTMRYAGYEELPDDTADARLKDPHTVGVLTYASAGRVIREALVSSDDPKQAQSLRSFADATRSVTLVETATRALKISIGQNYPSPPAPVTITIPIARDDLDIAHAQMPAHLHVRFWKRQSATAGAAGWTEALNP